MAQTHSIDLESGSSQHLSITDASQTGLDITGDMTIECWAKLESQPPSNNNMGIVGKRASGAGNRAYNFYYGDVSGTTKLGFTWTDDGTNQDDVGHNYSLETGRWYHLAVSIDVSGPDVKWYVDGELVDTDSSGTRTSIYDNDDPFYIGTMQATGDYFDGLMKDVRVFSDVRTASEIASDAATQSVSDANLEGEWNLNNALTDSSGNGNTLTNNNSATFATDIPWEEASSVSGSTYLETNLVSHWELEETSGTRVDSKGSNDLTDNNTVTQSTGKQGNDAVFARANSESLSITDNASLSITGDFSFACWVKYTSLTNNQLRPFFGKDASSNRSYAAWFYNNAGTHEFRGFISDDGSGNEELIVATGTLSTATWYHVVGTWDASESLFSFYLDGVRLGTATGAKTSIYDGNADWYMGRFGVLSGDYTDAELDEFGLYNRVLHYGDVIDLYNSGDGIPYTADSGPASLKTFNTIATASIKTVDTVAIASVKTIDTIT